MLTADPNQYDTICDNGWKHIGRSGFSMLLQGYHQRAVTDCWLQVGTVSITHHFASTPGQQSENVLHSEIFVLS